MRLPGDLLSLIIVSLLSVQGMGSFDIDWGTNGHGACPAPEPAGTFSDLIFLNKGQISCSDVIYHTRNVYFTSDGIIFRFNGPGRRDTPGYDINDRLASENPGFDIIRMRFLDSNRAPPTGFEELPSKCNFFRGDDPGGWTTDVPCYRSVIYRNLYDGIDLSFRTMPEGMKYDFVIHPDGSLDDIRFKYEGAETGASDNAVILETPTRTIREGDTVAYQEMQGKRTFVDVGLIEEGGVISYSASFDSGRDLVIDPLIYSSTFGGSGGENGLSLALDPAKSSYFTGYTNSIDFPTVPGSYDDTLNGNFDVFVAKLDSPGGNLVYSAFIGGTKDEIGNSVAVDSSGNAYVCGYTQSADFPTTPGAFDRIFNGTGMDYSYDGFVVKLNGNGSRMMYSTFIGGIKEDYCNALAVDSAGCGYVTGVTGSADFPVTPGALNITYGYEEAFVLKLASTGSGLVYSTFLGGSGWDEGKSIALFPNGSCSVVGLTDSTDFPVTPGAYEDQHSGYDDCFVSTLNPDGSGLAFSTLIGGQSSEIPFGVCLDSESNIYVTGVTYSPDFPTTQGALDRTRGGKCDSFIVKLDSNGTDLLLSTYLGGQLEDEGSSIALDQHGNVYVTGMTSSPDFPTTPGAHDTTANGEGDIFISILAGNGTSFISSTFLGGSTFDWGNSIVVDSDCLIYITGGTQSTDFPTVNGTARGIQIYGYEVVVVRLDTYPGAPRDLRAGPSDSEIQLNWSEPEKTGEPELQTYLVFRGTDPSNLTLLNTTAGRSFKDTGVTNGFEYHYAVAARNFFGTGERSAVVAAAPGAPPTPPRNLTGRGGDGLVELEWLPPEDPKGFPVSGYTVLRGTNETSLGIVKDIGNLTNYTDLSVKNDNLYYYAIAAHNSRGQSALSNVISASPGRLPAAPRNLAGAAGDNHVSLQWEPPEGILDIVILGYSVYRGIAEGELYLLGETGGLSYDDTTVANGVRYRYSVSATGFKGEGPMCDPITAAPGRAPGAPELFLDADDGRVLLTWNCPDGGGLSVTSFNVYKGNTTRDVRLLVNTIYRELVDEDVTNGVSYYYRVSAINDKGEGPASPLKKAVPHAQPGQVVDLTATGGDSFIIVSWKPPLDGAPYVVGYHVHRLDTGTGRSSRIPVSDTVYYDMDVRNGVIYCYSVSAFTDKGDTVLSHPVYAMASGRPGAVTNLTATPGYRHVLVAWTVPDETGGSAIVRYRVFRSTSPTDYLLFGETTEESFNDTSVENGITYRYRVSAVNQRVEGPFAETNATVTWVPGPPENFRLAVEGRNILLKWDPPTDTGGSMITGFVVYKGRSRHDMRPVSVVTGHEYADREAGNGDALYYMVCARNARGEGAPTDILSESLVTPEAPSLNTTELVIEVIVLVTICVVSALAYRRMKRRGD